MYVEFYLLSNVVLILLHVKDTNPTTYVCDILIFHIFINVELSDVYLHVMYRLRL